MAEERQDARTTPPGRRLTVSEAAGALGISAEAVRSRLKRGTLRSVKDDATVYVLLETDQSRPDTAQTPPDPDQTYDQSELVAQLRDEIAFLRDQVRRQQEITAQQAVTMRALTAPGEPEASEGATPQPGREAAEEPAQPRPPAALPWWRRIFGG